MPTALVGTDWHTAVCTTEPIRTVAPPLNAFTMPSAHGGPRAGSINIASLTAVLVVALAHAVIANTITRAIFRADFDAA